MLFVYFSAPAAAAASLHRHGKGWVVHLRKQNLFQNFDKEKELLICLKIYSASQHRHDNLSLTRVGDAPAQAKK